MQKHMTTMASNPSEKLELIDDIVGGIAATSTMCDGEMRRHGAMSTVSESFFWLTAPKQIFTRELPASAAVVCFSPIRWDSHRRRPQHLMSRCADGRRVFYVEEPVFSTGTSFWLDISERDCGVWVAVPYLPEGMTGDEATSATRALLDEFFAQFSIDQYILWYYSPAALPFSRHLRPIATVYDRMNELAGPYAPGAHESELIRRADLVFTESAIAGPDGTEGTSKIHLSPESVDRDHFMIARDTEDEPFQQGVLPSPRIGYYGPIDARLDLNLLASVADARPDWQLVLVGTVENGTDLGELLSRRNVHLYEGKDYQEIPYYMAGWNVAMLPYRAGEERGASTAMEYLAAGRPVVATHDVLKPFGREKLVHTAETLAEFIIAAADAGMDETPNRSWLRKADRFLARTCWDRTWSRVIETVEAVVGRRRIAGVTRQRELSPLADLPYRG